MMHSTSPLISVIMPAYNAGRFIAEAIMSVKDQTYTNWELLVLDDGSTDDTCAVVEKLAAEDPRIKLLPNAQNMGVAKTRNRGFDLCRGEYAALLDSDDRWYPNKLEKQLNLALQAGADVIYCSYGIVDEQGNKRSDDFIVPPTTDFDEFLVSSVISCSTALLSRQVIEKYRFVTDFYHEDLALWLQLLRDGYTARGVEDVLADYRVMSGTRASNKLKSALNRWRIFRKHLKLPLGKSMVSIVRYGMLGLKKYSKKKQ